MICEPCRNGRHSFCVDMVALDAHADWAERTPGLTDGQVDAGRPTRHCACQHAGSPVADNPADRPVSYETTYAARPTDPAGQPLAPTIPE